MRSLQRLRGMEDRGPAATRAIAQAAGALDAFLSLYGYGRVDTPVLEETELLLRKSGGELASKMYTFTDPGGHRVSLRPEFTSSVVRAYLQGMNGGALPVRWSYQGPVFRYEAEEVAGPRQFTQVGAEIIGAVGPWADAEVLAVASKGVSHLGIVGHQLVVSHLGFIGKLLEYLDLSDRARLFLLSNVALLSRGADGVNTVRQRAEELGLLARTNSPPEAPESWVREAGMDDWLEHSLQGAPAPLLGGRTQEEIRERILRKRQTIHDSGSFDEALDILARVAQIQGGPQQALREVRAVVASLPASGELDYLEKTLSALGHYQLDMPVTLDFGLARGIAYYTGIVFEISDAAVEGVSLGGGGRYDDLVQALGGAERLPAMGFAWSLERVVETLMAQGGSLKAGGDVLVVRPEGAEAMTAALGKAEELRAEGKLVQMEMGFRSLEECLKQAQLQSIQQILTVDSAGKVTRKNVPERR